MDGEMDMEEYAEVQVSHGEQSTRNPIWLGECGPAYFCVDEMTAIVNEKHAQGYRITHLIPGLIVMELPEPHPGSFSATVREPAIGVTVSAPVPPVEQQVGMGSKLATCMMDELKAKWRADYTPFSAEDIARERLSIEEHWRTK